jgi:hypothetical protein
MENCRSPTGADTGIVNKMGRHLIISLNTEEEVFVPIQYFGTEPCLYSLVGPFYTTFLDVFTFISTK